jgi:hypothetical protein
MDKLDQVLSIVDDDEGIEEEGATYENTPSTQSTGPCALFARYTAAQRPSQMAKKGGRPPERRMLPHVSALSKQEVDEQ